MRSNREQFYNAIVRRGRHNTPTMGEARRDLERAFRAAQIGNLAN